MAGGGSTGWFADPLLMGVAGRGPEVAVAGGLALDIVEGLVLMPETRRVVGSGPSDWQCQRDVSCKRLACALQWCVTASLAA